MSDLTILEVVSGIGQGGAEKILLQRLPNLPSNIEVKVLNLRPSKDYYELPTEVTSYNLDIGYQLFSWRLWRFVKDISPDIIVVRTPLDFIRLSIVRILLKQKSWKFIFEIHSKSVSFRKYLSSFMNPLLSLFRNLPDKVFVVSHDTSMGALAGYFLNPTIFYFGAERMPNFTPSETTELTFIFIGRFDENKRPLWLLQRIYNLDTFFRRNSAKVLLVGQGCLLERAKQFVDSAKMNDYVDILGPSNDVALLLSKADYLLSPSISEGLPIVFFEAKLHGVKIIATPSGGGGEILDRHDLVLRDFSPEAFEEALLKALESKPDIIEKIEICEDSNWMDSRCRSAEFYKFLIHSIIV